jgi:hypothetical protein
VIIKKVCNPKCFYDNRHIGNWGRDEAESGQTLHRVRAKETAGVTARVVVSVDIKNIIFYTFCWVVS